MNDEGPFIFVLVVGVILIMLFGFGYGLFQYMVAEPPTAQDAWLRQQIERCTSMRSNLNFDEKTKVAECYRTPFMRRPKLMFAEKFEGASE